MAIIRTTHTLWLIEDLLERTLGEMSLELLPGILELSSAHAALRSGEGLLMTAAGQLLWREEYPYQTDLLLGGRDLDYPREAQVNSARLTSEAVRDSSLDRETASLTFRPFNPYTDDLLHLHSGSHGWFWRSSDGQQMEQYSSRFTGNLQLDLREGEPSGTFSHLQATSSSFRRESDETWSSREMLTLQSRQGFGIQYDASADLAFQARFDSIQYMRKGSYVNGSQQVGHDELYRSSETVDFSALLETDSLESLVHALLAGDDRISAPTGSRHLLADGSVAAGTHLWGAGGNDVIAGSDGDDWISGGAGADRLKGGRGHDTFIFTHAADSTPDATDTILDFKAGEDTLWFEFLEEGTSVRFLDGKASLASLQSQASDAFAQGYGVVVGSDGKQGYVLADANGDAQADLLINLTGIKGTSAFIESDFAFG